MAVALKGHGGGAAEGHWISVLGANMVPTWSQNGDQNPGISWTFRATLPRRLQGGQMEAKELQNGAKMEPKGSQMERKWSSKRAKIDKTISGK